MTRKTQTKGQPRKKKKNKSKILLITLIILLSLICIPLIGGGGLFLYYIKSAPELNYTNLEESLGSTLLDVGEHPYEVLGKKRSPIEPNEIPPQLKDAILSIEDKRFESHIGVDPVRIMGAAISNFKGNRMQGGSTLTQQLIKLSFFSTKEEDQTLKRKAQEAWLSVELEKSKSKDEILTYYINRVYMANGFSGMKTASDAYFDKDFNDLSLAQYALLAGLPQAPNDYDPYLHEDNAKKRRDIVLSEMLKDKKISQADYDTAVATPVSEGLVPLKENATMTAVTDNYVSEVIKQVEEETGLNVYTDGLEIHTNMDLAAQTYLYNLMNNDNSSINFPEDSFQAAATLMDVKTGAVTAQIGGRKTGDDQLQFNRATEAKRNIGSTAKPLVAYAPTIEELNYGSGEMYVDEPYAYSDGTAVNNYDMSFRGPLTMREALVDSRNTVALKALKEVGNDKSQDFIHKLGLDNNVYEGTALGFEASTEHLAGAYAAFANGGIYYEPNYINKIVYPDGREEIFKPNGQRAMKESTAYIVTDMLKDVINRGTGMNAQIPGVIQAGKTGTSNYPDDVIDKVIGEGVPDITFVGYTPKYSLAVWTGYNDYFESISYPDQLIAMDIYRNFMTYLYQNLEITDWKQPDDVVRSGNQVYVKNHLGNQSNSWGYSNYSPPAPVTPKEPVVPESTPPSSSASTEEPASSTPAPPATSNTDTNGTPSDGGAQTPPPEGGGEAPPTQPEGGGNQSPPEGTP